ncbi:glycogen debranching N-terminal domain-containing protein [Amorphoplanes nipponensis]|uniref:Amylo-alpha-1,6-glucosidase n=1 Tax=Actinoplanes nipponensis TaxID=135950 RepID=A0A919JPA0_9ACTN|nr:glycogen debranching N-terminal domain-containing protein [Actinoplanes nipponensis]GIE53273.1 amylo-alpha-1,6-glucosidase [Actinoplanes nipponensis]
MHRLQPLLHELVATVAAPTTALSGADGQIRAAGVQGAFHADVRVLSTAVLRLDEREPEPIGHADAGAGTTRFVSLARWLGDPGTDPTVRIERARTVTPARVAEEIRLSSTAAASVRTTVTVELAADLAPIELVRSGGRGTPVAATRSAGGLSWARDGVAVTVTAAGAELDERGRLRWAVTLGPRGDRTLSFTVRVDDPSAVVHAPARARDWSAARVSSGDQRLGRLVARSLDDLHALRLADGDDVYLGAGVPWYLTLFGRDSIWAARMLLPLGTGPAAGTLRVLARRQGARTDPQSGEAPGKILHELRRHEFALPGTGLRLPAAYYGSVDATPLWVSLLHDAWRWGLPEAEVGALLPHLEAALGWLAGYAGGFLTYHDTTGHGLANQGWKDSADALGHAEPPIALAEAQGYAHRAALDGAALLAAFGRPGGDRWREYAATLADRFRSAFWLDGGYPAPALDRDQRPVDALTSNIGHLLGTGLLNAAEERAVATALGGEAMSGAYGLRTMSARDAGYAPLSYHCGSVWAHDTAIVAAGLARAGFDGEATTLIDGLLTAAEAFGYRLPELHAGDARAALSRPMPYPAACRPQAWSAAAAVLLTQAALGLEPDVPGGRVRLRPLAGTPFGPLDVRGLRIAGEPVDVRVDATGAATMTGRPAGLRLD